FPHVVDSSRRDIQTSLDTRRHRALDMCPHAARPPRGRPDEAPSAASGGPAPGAHSETDCFTSQPSRRRRSCMSSKRLARFCEFWLASRLTCVRLVAAVALCGSASVAAADVVSFGGTITQPQDPSNPAANNPTLNGINSGDAYTVTLAFSGSITAPGTYGGGTLTFTDAAAGAIESSFGAISLTITANGAFDDFSLLGCLTTGSGCPVGNQLDAS